MNLEKALAGADIKINGSRPWDIQVHNKRFYRRIALKGSLGAGESYVDGDWDCERLDEAFFRLFRHPLDGSVSFSFPNIIQTLRHIFFNPASRARAFEVGKKHYDRDINLFRQMLDKRMAYSCAYWKGANDLDQAQVNKFKLIADKIGLKPGMKVLDVGSGFGGFALWAEENYGVEVTGITVSTSQLEEARKKAQGKKTQFFLKDWRDLEGKWDRMVSIGQFEHVGLKNYFPFMKKMRSLLQSEGLFLLHTIGNDQSYLYPDPWIEKYIFPNGLVPSLKQIAQALEGHFIVEDLHNLGPNYDKTLMAWYHNFDQAFPEKNSPFYRLWSYYLLSTAAAFRARRLELWQFVLSPEGNLAGYERP